VELETHEGTRRLQLLIVDDGRGFAARPPASGDGDGFGMISMRERMHLVGGELDVESAPGWGTRVVARLTVPPVSQVEVPSVASVPANETETIRLLLVDDHPLAREGLRRLLADRPEIVVVGEATDGVEGVERSLAVRPDVILMDLQMPRLSGAGAIRALRDAWPDARVLVVTTFAQDEHLFEALRAGARGYLLKSAGPTELVDAIRAVHEGGAMVQPSLTARLVDRLGPRAEREQLVEPLTEREIEVLRALATGARNKEIAAQLVVAEKTVKHHVGQIHAKLGVRNRTEAVARGRDLGIVPLDSFALA
jgi:DNA-binding NarL/FixJ family response regulator